MRSVRVLVVGGGIGGLSAARALRSAGAKVRVYEQAAELGEVGAGVGNESQQVTEQILRSRRCPLAARAACRWLLPRLAVVRCKSPTAPAGA